MNQGRLERHVGFFGALVIGLGSILGTGAFVGIGVASANWGDAVFWAIPLAALVAVFNGLSAAFLAGRFPVAGGTYEYAYRTLNPWFGFSAGWLFLLAKTASAASAALGISLYLGANTPVPALGATLGVMVLILAGIRRTTMANTVLVTITLSAIVWFVWHGLSKDGVSAVPVEPEPSNALLGATAFLFVAYTGYGRIATLGEEVKDPGRVIPIAVVMTLTVAAGLYMAIELAGRALGGEHWGSILELGFLDLPFVTLGAITAMVGVLLNLILGLSRVWLAMGRRGDMPGAIAKLDSRNEPILAVAVSGVLVATLALLGDFGLAWSFSAMTVLLYYGVTNLAVLALDRRRVTAWLGMGSCVFLSFFVPAGIWMVGAGLIVLGLVWKGVYTRFSTGSISTH